MIGYYVHHHGDGHITRAAAIARRLGDKSVTGLSSRGRHDEWAGPWVHLARDDDPPASDAGDPTAGGALHWSPARHPGLRKRMAQIAAWGATHDPRLVVVDVSVEVAVLVRSMGVPVVVMGMPGVREDAAHQLAYRLADAILAPWPEWAELLVGGAAWQDKLHAVGAISRFEERARPSEPGRSGRQVLVLSGRGGTELTERALAAAQRAVVIPQERPHREQRATADAVRDAGLAVVCSSWPEPHAWPALLSEAARRGGEPWALWSSGSGAARAAAVLEEPCAHRGDHHRRGAHEHLARQRALLNGPERHVVVAMGDGEADRCRAICGESADVIGVPDHLDGLPLARARNAGARRALGADAELLVFLDVDCLPGPALLRRYREAAASAGSDALLCGPVAYLPPAPRGGYPSEGLEALASAHPARPVPPENELERGGDHSLFWTLSFAITASTWRRVGGFCEDYVGYGGEDTDYGQLARRAGVDLCWVGGAWAYHQHHPVESPPVRHLGDILRNAAIFHRRWGWWPMCGWLHAFAARGLARHDSETNYWVSLESARAG